MDLGEAGAYFIPGTPPHELPQNPTPVSPEDMERLRREARDIPPADPRIHAKMMAALLSNPSLSRDIAVLRKPGEELPN